jgi:hypothetical protein
MEPNLAVSIYVRSSIKFLHFVPFGLLTWPPRIILFSDWLMLKKYLIWPIGSGELKNDEKRGTTPRRVIRFTSKLQGM